MPGPSDENLRENRDDSVISGRFAALGFDDLDRRYRLGIMGGTFNPIHFGHLVCAEQAREKFDLDAVIFIPAAQPAGKDPREVACGPDRLAMVRLAIQGNPWFDSSDIEQRRGGVTYTVDTLRDLRAHYPENVELFFITGSDSVRNLELWHGAQEMMGLATFIGATRPGYDLNEARRHNATQRGLHVEYIAIPALAISSTDLRKRVAEERSIRYLTPDGVIGYIEEHGLYESGEGER